MTMISEQKYKHNAIQKKASKIPKFEGQIIQLPKENDKRTSNDLQN
jgi:hypothetical protein